MALADIIVLNRKLDSTAQPDMRAVADEQVGAGVDHGVREHHDVAAILACTVLLTKPSSRAEATRRDTVERDKPIRFAMDSMVCCSM